LGIEYGHTDATKTYRRHPHSIHQLPLSISSEESKSNGGAGGSNHRLGSRDDNLIHLMSISSSASKMNDLSASEISDRVHVRPRLSRSEENLIDLDTPGGLGFTQENPLYELVMNSDSDNVFEERDKTDAQLLMEYGLSDYFNQMNMSHETNDEFENSFSNLGATCNKDCNQKGINDLSTTSNSYKWTTFE